MRTVLLLLVGSAVGLDSVPAPGQVLRGGQVAPKRTNGARALQVEADGGSRRNDLEGSIWEYKVMENSDANRSTRTKMSGKIRIKQSALFAVGQVKRSDSEKPVEGAEAAGDPRAAIRARLQGDASTPASGGAVRSGDRLSELRAAGESLRSGRQDVGAERIGDLAKQESSELQFRFDEDDSYPLSGRAAIKPDTDNRGGLWTGSYDEFVDGKKAKRWRIEMRKVEE